MEVYVGSVSRDFEVNQRRDSEKRSQEDHALALVGLVLTIVSLVFAMLATVASFSVAMFGSGVIVGVLVAPQARRAAAWLAVYLSGDG